MLAVIDRTPSTHAPIMGVHAGAGKSPNGDTPSLRRGGATTPERTGLSAQAVEALASLLPSFSARALSDALSVEGGAVHLRLSAEIQNLPLGTVAALLALASGTEPGGGVLVERIVAAPLPARAEAMKPLPQRVHLTPRQRQVVDLMCLGLCNKEIARKLGITEGSVKVHGTGINRALGASNRTHAVMRWMEVRRAGGLPA